MMILNAGDILISVSVNEKTTEITRQYHVIDMMLDVRQGDVISIKLLRGGHCYTQQSNIFCTNFVHSNGASGFIRGFVNNKGSTARVITFPTGISPPANIRRLAAYKRA